MTSSSQSADESEATSEEVLGMSEQSDSGSESTSGEDSDEEKVIGISVTYMLH